MPDEPDTPLAPTRFIHPGADITDGATGKPYSQAGEKSAGQLLYERWVADRINPDRYPSWGELSAVDQRRHEFEAGKSAGQLLYEKSYPIGSKFILWADLPEKTRARHEFNATATPKAQTIKAP